MKHQSKLNLTSNHGFSLVEILIAIGVFLFILTSIFGSYILYFRMLNSTQNKMIAQNLALEQMEILKNKPYDSLATQNGTIYPPGNIPDNQNHTVSDKTYRVQTIIAYVDDPFDGDVDGTISDKPKDLYSYDYKKVTINVYQTNNPNLLSSISTNIAAKAAETPSNTGILAIKVINSKGDPVQFANIRVQNDKLNPILDINTSTDINGLVLIPGLPPDNNNDYQVIASLDGYSTDQTYSAYPPDHLSPTQPNLNILVQQVTDQTLIIDRLGSLSLTFQDPQGSPNANLDFKIAGSKQKYQNPDELKYSQTLTTNSEGKSQIDQLEWDSYTITLPGNKYLVASSPYQPINLAAGQSQNVILTVTTDPTYPTISKVSPANGVINTTVDFTISGTNLFSGSTVALISAGNSPIIASGVTSIGNLELTGTFDLTGTTIGTWDLQVTTPQDKSATQKEGFNVSSN